MGLMIFRKVVTGMHKTNGFRKVIIHVNNGFRKVIIDENNGLRKVIMRGKMVMHEKTEFRKYLCIRKLDSESGYACEY